MKKIFLAILLIVACIRSFAQFPILSDIYDDYEFSITPTYQTNGENIFYNNGTNVEIEIRQRIKIKFPNNSGCTFCYGPNVTFPIFFEDMGGTRHLVGEFLHNSFWQYEIEIGKIYSKYSLAKFSFKPEIRALGKGKLYFGVYEKYDPFYKTAATAHILKTKVDINFVQVPNFVGPSEVCSEATYTIERPGTVTIESASGIATLTAMGNNQWKVTKIGNNNGNIILRSTSQGKTFDFPIKVGADKNAGSFMKPPINSTGIYAIRFNDSKNDFDPSSITWSIRSPTNNVNLRNNTGKIVNVEVNSWNNSGQNNIIITFNATTVCGETISRDLNIGPGSEILDPDA